ncbi:MAG: nucleotidyltransferase domain-containing protein [Chloroflexi bacterium]|nr:nucleotidyltransferase domain-containing protein [Chloroflexota bacterium]
MLSDDKQPRCTEPPQLDEAGLVAFLATQEDIVAAYLFGSLAQGRAGPRSDIDIAVLLRRVPDPASDERDPRFRLMDELRRFADREADVIILNTAPALLQNQVLRYGRLLYERNPGERIAFEMRSGKIYDDLAPMNEFFTRVLMQEIKEVGLGGRRRRDRRTAQSAAR